MKMNVRDVALGMVIGYALSNMGCNLHNGLLDDLKFQCEKLNTKKKKEKVQK